MAAVRRRQVQPTIAEALALIADIRRNAVVQDAHESRGVR